MGQYIGFSPRLAQRRLRKKTPHVVKPEPGLTPRQQKKLETLLARSRQEREDQELLAQLRAAEAPERPVIASGKMQTAHTDAVRLTPDDLLRWKASLLDAGLRTKTIRDSKIAPVRAILRWGVDNRKLAANPAARIVIDVRSKMTERIRASRTRKPP